ncbi:penicillin-binding transpeptidase domain-containing protein [Streptomyces genisteinicus]|uniref:Penicillin-binding protein 2 n=1 Tax=Streptomyces genisteinicus TaxID=2768068 RepID=A0A7H0HXM0_9ACTN|nr:penicillin-binding transpeptidase domain-containing protein [Streptomyces genisteinicus]QNP65286.1 penicillin-binding protein 2 [Streptomyces genisteinicus]
MIRRTRHAAGVCAVLLAALLVNAARVQVVESPGLEGNPGNRRADIARYGVPRGDILVDSGPVTGSRDTGGRLRYERTYRDGPLYAPVTGYASQTYGTSLLENLEDGILAGTDPLLSPLPLLDGLHRVRPPGGHVVTTVRAAVQEAAYRGLDGRRGAVAAIEPSSGRILALVSSPSYDPGRFAGTDGASADAWARLNGAPARPMLNRAIRQTYPPGSAFKIVTAAAALDSGVVDDVDAPTRTPRPYVLPGTSTVLPDAVEGCENASLAYALQWSCNTVMAGLGARVGLRGMVEAAAGFGFNDPGLRIPAGVSRSNFDTDMSRDQLALSSIGQFNTTATPLQMAMVASAVAAGGTLRHPYLVEKVTRAGGETAEHHGPRAYRQAMNPATAMRLREMMVQAVEEGTGRKAAIGGATVGGKTGTAQHGVGNKGTPYAWFISWAQADDAPLPGVAVAVVVEDASADRAEISGGGSAAPIARAVMRAALHG